MSVSDNAAANAIDQRAIPMMWGWSFAVSEWIVKASLVAAVITGFLTAFFAFVAGYVGYELADAIAKVSDENVAKAQSVAETARADAAKSNLSVAKADERIAELGKEAAKLSADANASKAEIAKANERVAEANLALEKLKLPRRLDENQITLMKGVTTKYPKQYFVVSAYNDPDSTSLAISISDVLTGGGWIEKDWKDQTGMIIERPNRVNIGLANISGILVAADRNSNIVTQHAVAELAPSIRGINFKAVSIVGNLADNHNGSAIIIIVGQKTYD